ncbi:glutathione S-transferase family protein [Luteimonas sp. 3794]|uniref:glutathione S-transferase family protein n=1 Tax=Luteimonas sp. 3794 TaxID=2817730 RepID=UPI002855FF23|nr:glutathione S-transferase family protein [Luteimonas sp. 3794]MDR6990449.1 glutathione S-transferase [Luteimonas sp. 3794]
MTTDDLVLYTNPMSRGRIARWMLEESGQPYRTELLDYGDGMKAPAFLAINPMGKVPALVHGDAVVTEAAAICAYLAQTFPGAGLLPEDTPRARAAYHRWLFFAAGPLEAAVTAKSLGLLAPAERAQMVGYGNFDQTVETLVGAVSDAAPWIAGARFTAADVYVGSQIAWGLMFKSLPAHPAFVEYVERLQARPAWQRASALDDAAMPKQS